MAINEKKTRKMNENQNLHINNKIIQKVQEFKYLGEWLMDNCSNFIHIENRLDKHRNMSF